ncbi:MAG: undecaprenyl-diphosphate phosphatase [Candidatus Aenigmarchaeota archaeon]|nr:undecaprenyl-diphosphate phosphatase [Candidatus Aenigmarchaeota archaeon]
MEIFHALILGIVQGITEWLPVSSSGHLVVLQNIFGITQPLFFDAVVHFGTLLAVVLFLRKEIAEILKSAIKMDFMSESGRLVPLALIATVPAAFFGFFFRDFLERLFYSTMAVGIALIITGIILFLSERKQGSRAVDKKDALIIGIAQAAAIVPGISRSGATISAGLFRGIDKEKAAKFSFLISIPAIAGALVLESGGTASTASPVTLLIGGATAFFVGYLSLKMLMKILIEKKFKNVAYYCWFFGAVIILASIWS